MDWLKQLESVLGSARKDRKGGLYMISLDFWNPQQEAGPNRGDGRAADATEKVLHFCPTV